jgi:hypothetical protein
MNLKRPLLGLLAPGAFMLMATAAPAATISSNWAGYAVSGKKFRHVSATWVEPKLSCTSGQRSYSAFWVGLGGFSLTSQALEQTGTEADCGANGKVTQFAWYELVPAGMVITHAVRLHAGDTVTASIAVKGHSVRVHIADGTTHKSFTRTLRMSKPAPDTTAAEWILEAPSVCNAFGACVVLPLANFGTFPLGSASATTVGGHTGSISDPAWSATEVAMMSGGRGFGRPHFLGGQTDTGAVPSALSATGDAFSVTFAAPTPASAPPSGFPS